VNCPSCGGDAPALARFCPECGTAFSRGCGSCGAELSAAAKFCAACGSATGTAPAANRAAADRSPRDYTPKHLAERILQSKSALEGERKQVFGGATSSRTRRC